MPVILLEGMLLIALISIAVSIIFERKLLACTVIYCAFSFLAAIAA